MTQRSHTLLNILYFGPILPSDSLESLQALGQPWPWGMRAKDSRRSACVRGLRGLCSVCVCMCPELREPPGKEGAGRLCPSRVPRGRVEGCPLGRDYIILPLGTRRGALPSKLRGAARPYLPSLTPNVSSLAWLGAIPTSWAHAGTLSIRVQALCPPHPLPEPSTSICPLSQTSTG